jgi:hypothetical protein
LKIGKVRHLDIHTGPPPEKKVYFPRIFPNSPKCLRIGPGYNKNITKSSFGIRGQHMAYDVMHSKRPKILIQKLHSGLDERL